MLSILILTHNRPELFKRCIASVLDNLPNNVDIEIIVNNDSCDIVEIHHPQVRYMYYAHNDLSMLYKLLFDSAKNDMVMFLEDDDYLVKSFFNHINYSVDMNYMNFVPVHKDDLRLSTFGIEKDNDLFQLSQIAFKKHLLKEFPTGNVLDNDFKLFQQVHAATTSINIIKTPMFIQTTDGKDNISFKEYNNDKRFN